MENKSSGIGFFGLLTILFIGLKLSNMISWSWWWTLSPMWLPLLVISIAILFVLIVFKIS